MGRTMPKRRSRLGMADHARAAWRAIGNAFNGPRYRYQYQREFQATDRELAEVSAAKFHRRHEEVKRRQSLSLQNIAGSDAKHSKKRRTCDQQQSPLGRLPAEIRVMIWEKVICPEGRIDLDLIPRRDGRAGESLHIQAKTCLRPEYASPFHLTCFEGNSRRWKFPALLLCCRIFYTEALDILYSTNNFAFDYAETFLAFSRIVPPSHWKRIKRLTIDTIPPEKSAYADQLNNYTYGPDKLIQVVAYVVDGMPNLQELNVSLHGLRVRDARYENEHGETWGQYAHPLAEEFESIRVAAKDECKVFVFSYGYMGGDYYQLFELLGQGKIEKVGDGRSYVPPSDPSPFE